MKITDFRIGNLVWSVGEHEPLRISDLTSKDGTIYNDSDICSYVIDRSKYPLPEGWRFEPIPITEDWLMKLGFEKRGLCFFSVDDFMIEQSKGKGNYLVAVGTEYNIGKPFEYVHQLQNIYHALEGNELTYAP